MAGHFASVDWSATPLGAVTSWSPALKTSVQLCLNSSFPMTVGWGEQLTLVYNDGCIPIMGRKHPAGLGRPALEVYEEFGESLASNVARVLEFGEEVWATDLLMPMQRASSIEEGYFTLCHSPLLDDDGSIRGVLSVATETTRLVQQQRRQLTIVRLAETLVERRPSGVLPEAVRALGINQQDIAKLAVFEVAGDGSLKLKLSHPPTYAAELEAEGPTAWQAVHGELARSTVTRLDARRFAVTLLHQSEQPPLALRAIVEPAAMVRPDETYAQFLEVLGEISVGALYRLRAERAELAVVRRELDDRDRLYRMLFEHSSEAIVISRMEGGVVAANPAACRLLGYAESEIIALGVGGVVVEDEGALGIARREYLATGRFDGPLRHRRKDGSEFVADVSSVSILDEHAGGGHILTLLRDDTPRLVAEERIIATSRLEALGRLTGGISHDFNNLLNVIINGAEDISDSLPESDPAAQSAKLVLSASLRAAELTRQLLAFSQHRPVAAQRLSLSAAVEEVHQLLTRVLGAGISTRIETESDAVIKVDPSLLHSALLNLCINARDAMPDGGELTLTVKRSQVDAGRTAVLKIPMGEYAAVTVADTGVGIPAARLSQVVEPYYTTNPTKQSTGLGLSMVYGFARQSDGALLIESQEGAGTRMTLLFPLFSSEPATLPSPRTANQESRTITEEPDEMTGEHVLVVEDNDLLAAMLSKILERAGYRVTLCTNGEEALPLLGDGMDVDLLITDIQLGAGINGWELARTARAQHPELAMITMTGFAPSFQSEQARIEGLPNLSKPFRPKEVLALVREQLSGKLA